MGETDVLRKLVCFEYFDILLTTYLKKGNGLVKHKFKVSLRQHEQKVRAAIVALALHFQVFFAN